ncbi:MAG: glycosyltransferase family 2 protein [Nitrosomonadaceae bacterium]|nr:glycosyltransferase family 2 protein [Nitrosomonadaceae bacterium]
MNINTLPATFGDDARPKAIRSNLTMSLCVSLVSHGHGAMVVGLVKYLLTLKNLSELVLTLNILEDFPELSDQRLRILRNEYPRGFGENHNAAFRLSRSDGFCVLNPDIVFDADPFPTLFNVLHDSAVGLVAPLVLSADGEPEDSMRCFITPTSMAKRISGLDSGTYPVSVGGDDFFPDWVAGMFMLFRSEAYAKVGGFDERYFMYCEDADICTRIWKSGYKVVGHLSTSVIHNAQHASHRSWTHLSWHVQSMLRYFLSHSFSLPNKDVVIRRG